MDFAIPIMLFWILFSCIPPAEAKKFVSIITVPNGSRYGSWYKTHYCRRGFAYGFSLKVHEPQGRYDDTGLTGIRLKCGDKIYGVGDIDGGEIESAYTPEGSWTEFQYCPVKYGAIQTVFVGFSLRVEADGTGDDTGANNIKFKCNDGTILTGHGTPWGEYGPWSSCPRGYIGAIETKTFETYFYRDSRGLTDVKFYCFE